MIKIRVQNLNIGKILAKLILLSEFIFLKVLKLFKYIRIKESDSAKHISNHSVV